MLSADATALARAIAGSDARDVLEQKVHLDLIRDLKSILPKGTGPEVAKQLDTAVFLMGGLILRPGRDAEQVLAQVAALVGEVAAVCAAHDELRARRAAQVGAPPPVGEGMDVAEAPAPLPAAGSLDQREEGLPQMREMVLGEILLLLGVLSAEDLKFALQRQRETGWRIGEVLLRLGLATQDDIDRALELQGRVQRLEERARETPDHANRGLHLRGHAPDGARRSIPLNEPAGTAPGRMLGQVLVGMREITREQLARALEVQRAAGIRTGEALVQIGATSWKKVREALAIQKQIGYVAGGNRPVRLRL